MFIVQCTLSNPIYNVYCPMSNVNCPLSSVHCPLSSIKCPSLRHSIVLLFHCSIVPSFKRSIVPSLYRCSPPQHQELLVHPGQHYSLYETLISPPRTWCPPPVMDMLASFSAVLSATVMAKLLSGRYKSCCRLLAVVRHQVM